MALSLDIFFRREDWDRVLRSFPDHDFVHTFDFHQISQENGEGSPLIFAIKAQAENFVAFWPALKRSIPGTEFFDLTSVYGYAGPLFADREASSQCLDMIFSAMHDLRAVSLFSRMHPLFIDQIQQGDLRGERLGDVVVIDAHQQRPLASYRSGHRYEIRKSLANGMQVCVDYSCEAIGDFCEIYEQAMRELNAPEYYFFRPEYFKKLKEATDFKVILIFAELDSRKVAAAMFIVTGRLMQYYLSGTLDGYKHFSPSKAIIAKAHDLGVAMGVEKIVLGGGVSSREDQLFKFKNGFSDMRRPFHVFKKVISRQTYDDLCEARGIDQRATSFFPAYRSSRV